MQYENEQDVRNRKILCNAIALVVKEHREKLGKSMHTLSAEGSVNKASWVLLESKKVKYPSLVVLWKIAEALNMKPSELIKEVEDKLGDKFSLSGLN
ncbi:helix-turn-helix transcriptional regulator [bacterium]|nr:helix-turn-helix transcriptional regulator [bacterium]